MVVRVIEQELHKNAAVITKVSETASKEFAIESALDKMQGAWAAVKLIIEEYRETGEYRNFDINTYMRIQRVLEREHCIIVAFAVLNANNASSARYICFREHYGLCATVWAVSFDFSRRT